MSITYAKWKKWNFTPYLFNFALLLPIWYIIREGKPVFEVSVHQSINRLTYFNYPRSTMYSSCSHSIYRYSLLFFKLAWKIFGNCKIPLPLYLFESISTVWNIIATKSVKFIICTLAGRLFDDTILLFKMNCWLLFIVLAIYVHRVHFLMQTLWLLLCMFDVNKISFLSSRTIYMCCYCTCTVVTVELLFLLLPIFFGS